MNEVKTIDFSSGKAECLPHTTAQFLSYTVFWFLFSPSNAAQKQPRYVAREEKQFYFCLQGKRN